MKYLKHFDMISPEITLYYKQSLSHSSVLSGMITILSCFLCICSMIYCSCNKIKAHINIWKYMKVLVKPKKESLNDQFMIFINDIRIKALSEEQLIQNYLLVFKDIDTDL